MSVLVASKLGFYISHPKLIEEIYSQVSNVDVKYIFRPELFKIVSAYRKKQKRRNDNISSEDKIILDAEVLHVKKMYDLFYNEIKSVLEPNSHNSSNKDALNTADLVYNKCGQHLLKNLHGKNEGPCIVKHISTSQYLFPENCQFFCKDTKDLSRELNGQKFDLILLDPPWWNKYIRRKRKFCDDAYEMMYNDDLKNLPLEDHLNEGGLIVVWCTNSENHFTDLTQHILPKWGVEYVGKWYWVKITQSGMPVCEFSEPPKKQPFEQIIFASHRSRKLADPPHGKLVVSVPSALHSHKPPLTKLLEPFLPPDAKRLEIFSRYLLPNWTSYGRETLKFQHECLYEKISLLGIDKEDLSTQ